jgi:UDP-N-acetylglucosamine 2-epimerase
MTNINLNNIINAAEITLKKIRKKIDFATDNRNRIYPEYAEENVSDKIVSIIQSYTNYINKKVWFKF